jgi:predicted FMN-binding regulatory protein PaiB
MSSSPNLFAPRAPSDAADLIGTHALAWIVSRNSGGLEASTLPLLVHRDAAGAPVSLEGHFARSNPQLARLRQDNRALVLFLGPHGYISPTWVRDRTWAPTWNFAHTQFEVTLDFFEEPAHIEAHLRKLVAHMECERHGQWTPDHMGPRFVGLSRGVVGFHAAITRADARFKLGQDERPEIFEDICNALEGSELARLMQQQNKR